MLFEALLGLMLLRATSGFTDNYFTFVSDSANFSISIDVQGWVIESSDLYDETSACNSTIDVRAVCESSIDVGEAFSDGLTQENIFSTMSFLDTEPVSLYFFIWVDLYLKFGDDNEYVKYMCGDNGD